MTTLTYVVIAIAMFAGGVSAGAVGFGTVLVGAPIVALVAPHLLPVVFSLPSLTANSLVAFSERRHRDVPLLRRLVVWQLPGIVVGLWLLAQVRSDRTLGLVVSLVVLVMVGVSASPWRPARTPTTERVAAGMAGVAGALSATNGPPLAALLAHDDPGLIRATLPAYFLIAEVLLIGGWAVTGRLTAEAMTVGAFSIPLAVGGAALGQRVAHRWLTPRNVRILVLVLAATAAIRSLLG
jgi:uncharacterized protein